MANRTESTPRTGTGKAKKTAPKKPATKAASKPKDEKRPATKKAAPAKSALPASKKAASGSAATQPERTDQAARPITSEERHRLIAQAAYLRAEKRGFQNGDPEQDWLEAEKEIDAALTIGKGRARKT